MKRLSRGRGRVMAGVAVTAALLVPVDLRRPGICRAAPLQASTAPGRRITQYKVTICHLTGSKKHPAHTIRVSSKAVRGAPPPWRSPRRLHRHREAEARRSTPRRPPRSRRWLPPRLPPSMERATRRRSKTLWFLDRRTTRGPVLRGLDRERGRGWLRAAAGAGDRRRARKERRERLLRPAP